MGERGPKPKKINWNEFDKLAQMQATQEELADWFGVSLDSLERAFLRERGEKLAEFWSKKKTSGRLKLKKIQWQLAEQGSTAMAIFLGKYLLGQSDSAVDADVLEACQRAGVTKDQAVALIMAAAKKPELVVHKTFEEFINAASYPKAYPKQIEMVDFGMKETVPRLLLGSRGYGKTDYTVILGLAFEIYCNPLESRTLIVTKSKERNAAMIEEIKKACEANGMSFAKANSTSLRTIGLLGKDHSVSAVTLKTVSLRGRHPKRVIMDDPVTEDDTSEATRRLAEKKYNEILKLCSNVLVIGQPAHKHDLYAKLRGILLKMEVAHGSIPELDADLEAQRAAGVDEASISASYFLKVLSEGTTPFDNVKYMDRFPTGDSAVAFIDPASEGKDFTAISIIKAHMQGVAVVGHVWRKAWNHCLDDIAPLLKTYNVKRIAFETNSLGDQAVDVLSQTFHGVGVVGRKSNNNKHSRIMAAATYAHMIHLSRESSKKYLAHVVEYEYGAEFDDAPDSLATGLEWIGLIRGKK